MRGHLMRVGVSVWGHGHADRTVLRYVLPWHAWQTWEKDGKRKCIDAVDKSVP